MRTQFITVEVSLPAQRSQLPRVIVAALQPHGEPLRWAITEVTDQTVTVEAVVTLP